MRKVQAERCSSQQLEVHIERQQNLGEFMIGDNDRPRPSELLITGLALVVVCCYLYARYRGWLV